MSPTSYQAAPPRVIDITRLAALPQLDRRQVPDKCPKFRELWHADAQTALGVRPERGRRYSEWLKCYRVPKAWIPRTRGHPREVVALRTYGGTCADCRPQPSASCGGASSTEDRHSKACRSLS